MEVLIPLKEHVRMANFVLLLDSAMVSNRTMLMKCKPEYQLSCQYYINIIWVIRIILTFIFRIKMEHVDLTHVRHRRQFVKTRLLALHAPKITIAVVRLLDVELLIILALHVPMIHIVRPLKLATPGIAHVNVMVTHVRETHKLVQLGHQPLVR